MLVVCRFKQSLAFFISVRNLQLEHRLHVDRRIQVDDGREQLRYIQADANVVSAADDDDARLRD